MPAIENIEGIHCLRAANPGPMTLNGTNQYLLGHEEITMIDVALGSSENVSGLLAEAKAMGGQRIVSILLTHIHLDHCGGAPNLKERCGAQLGISATRAGHLGGEDFTYVDGDRIPYDGGELVVIHTPGHESGHCCFYEPQQKVLFTGDHILGRGTTVIPRGDGNMAHYIHSLEKLLDLEIQVILPGHGPVITDPHGKIREYIEHRWAREKQVLQCLGEGRQTLDVMVEWIYPDLAAPLLRAACASTESHLIKLMDEGRVSKKGERYFLVEPT